MIMIHILIGLSGYCYFLGKFSKIRVHEIYDVMIKNIPVIYSKCIIWFQLELYNYWRHFLLFFITIVSEAVLNVRKKVKMIQKKIFTLWGKNLSQSKNLSILNTHTLTALVCHILADSIYPIKRPYVDRYIVLHAHPSTASSRSTK